MDSSQAFDILTPIEILSRQIIQGYTEVKTLLVVLYTYAKIILHSPTEITPHLSPIIKVTQKEVLKRHEKHMEIWKIVN